MTAWLRDAPIRWKLVLLGLAASACALLVATLVFLVTTYLVTRRVSHSNVAAQAAITADNVTAALAFGDRSAAADTLRALKASPAMDMACLWTVQDELFAVYRSDPSFVCPPVARDLDRVDARQIELSRTILVGGRRIGTLYIRANLSDVFMRLRLQAFAALAALLLGTAAAMLFAVRYQRVVTGPLTSLAATASDISRRGDYSVRAAAGGRDELGALVATFNDMLGEIQRRDDDLRIASRLKDEFLATLSHELRTPLNAILGWLQILRMMPPSPERLQQALTSLDRNARAQARLVDDLLDLSRSIAGKLLLNVGVVELAALVDAAIDVVRPAAEAKQVGVEKRLDGGPYLVKGDPDRLQQTLWNLLSNAVKFSEPEGTVTIALTRASGEIVVTVDDTGIGIDPAFLPHIFEPFRQADASTTRKHGGLGLGLAIVRQIAQAHGGRVEASSAGLGGGARFVLHVPALRAEQGVISPMERPFAPEALLKGVSALVVDDDFDARELAALALTNGGASVVTAPDAAFALGVIDDRDIDVLVADLAMPGLDGYGLLERVRAKAGPAASLAAIAVTAHASPDEERRAIAAGFAAFLRKPYRLEDLVNVVATVARGPL